MICLVCDKNLDYVVGYHPKRKPSEGEPIDDGGTVVVSMGYGSKHDCQSALAYICDGCFDRKRGNMVNHYDGLAMYKNKETR